MLTFALLITLLLVGSGIWWLRNNVFLKTPNISNKLTSSNQVYTNMFTLGAMNLILINNDSINNSEIVSFSHINETPMINHCINKSK
ncbi:MAG: hypothetical protein AAF316_06800 [Cyanobacteria bacterium P01_A01_bin.80]